jgi:hypothetical protein
MKPFGVAVWSAETAENWRYFNDGDIINLPDDVPQGKMSGRAWADRHNNTEGINQCRLFWCDQRSDAEQLAQKVAKANPGCDAVVFESRNVYTAKVAEPTRRRITEKGILP